MQQSRFIQVQHDSKMCGTAQHIGLDLSIHLQLHAVLIVISQPCLAEKNIKQSSAFVSDLKPVRMPPVTQEGCPEP